jgi:hypothetical protein
MSRRYDYVDSWDTLGGGRMLGHRIAFQPSRLATDYGYTSFAGFGDYGAADTGRYFKITRDGTVFFKPDNWWRGGDYKVAFDGPSREKIISGEPGGYINATTKPWKRDVSSEARKQELDAAVVDSRGTYYEAEKRAKEIIAAGEAALEQAGQNIIPQAIQAGSGSELIAAYDERDRAGAEAARLAAEQAAAGKKPGKKKPKKRKPAKKGVPGWVWLAGGGAVLLLVIGGIVLKKRGAAQLGA